MNLKESGVQLDLIFWFISHGFSVVPLHLGSKIPRIRWGRYQRQLPTQEELLRWFRIPSNAAVVTGTNNLVVIDFDEVTEYLKWSMWAVTEGPMTAKLILRDAYKVRTARGIHVYTRASADVRNLHFGKIDIKGRGGLVTLPGSVHPSGAVYTEYQQGDFPLWSDLTQVFPAETLALMEREEPVRRVERERVDLNGLDADQVLNMPVAMDLNELKRRYRIEDIIPKVRDTNYGWYVAKCPFHDDNNPSFWVDTERQLCGCFGGCTAVPLDVINLFARLHGLSNSEAIRVMSERDGSVGRIGGIND
ncbi:MAG: bifunctional DNA primase/polymerase [Chloroflexi bacterium]|nr:bifunctional DNA primase/polymerase [Chloroflexota bacterium]